MYVLLPDGEQDVYKRQTVTRADAARMLSAAGTLLEGEPEGLFGWLF